MELAELEKRVIALESAVGKLQREVSDASNGTARHWWHDDAGRFANDPVFDEIVRLGREYRQSLHPNRRKKKKNARA